MGSEQLEPEVDPRSVTLQVQKILDSRQFATSPRCRRFLTYVVNAVLSGTAESLKEFTLGMEVFDKGPRFDPRLDTVVRVQARRVRLRLQAYYEAGGRFDPVVIQLPEGTYVPVIRVRPQAERSGGFDLHGKTIAVLPFSSPNSEATLRAAAEMIADDLVSPLCALGLRVLGARTSSPLLSPGQTPKGLGRKFGVDYLLTGAVHPAGDGIRVHAELVDAQDGFTLCSRTLHLATDRTLSGLEAAGSLVVAAIVETLTGGESPQPATGAARG